ncbi:MAG: FAD-binding oxidoreductase [Polyangiaceae bacterium]
MGSLLDVFYTQITRDFSADFVSRELADLETYGRDWTRVYAPAPSGVAFPRTTEEVARVLALATQHRVAIVPSGGRTGLAGGAVAMNGELVVSLDRMRKMDPVDALAATVRVEAGAVTQAVHEHCEAAGFLWPIDFASKGSSQVGGNISTNAGGVKVIRYGLTRQWVLGLEVVLASGEMLQLNGALEKNNTGFDLRQLFIGSEGTLGIVTAATLKLTRPPKKLDVMIFAVNDIPAILKLFRETRTAPFTLAAFEFFTSTCLARVLRHRKLRPPFVNQGPDSASHYVLVEAEDANASHLETWVASLFERGLANDGVMAQHDNDKRDLWALRESISESLSATGLPHKNDIALPVSELENFCAVFENVFAKRYPGWEICLFGHIGDGNLHVNVMKPEAMSREDFFAQTKEADRELFELVRAHHGSISAEHGIGLLKKDYLGISRSPGEISVLRAVKHALDPLGILNPGKIFD